MFTADDLAVIGVAVIPLLLALARMLQLRQRRIVRKRGRRIAHTAEHSAATSPIEAGIRPPVVTPQLQRVRRP